MNLYNLFSPSCVVTYTLKVIQVIEVIGNVYENPEANYHATINGAKTGVYKSFVYFCKHMFTNK